MAKPELGTKRIDPETGRKFYDLNRDPIVSPYTGKSYPRSYFETETKLEEVEEDADDDRGAIDSEEIEDDIEVVSLEDTEEEEPGTAPGAPDIDESDDDVIELDDDDDDDTFLADDEEEDDEDVSVIIKVGKDDEEI
jgi:uncharacterized protein (TIGR02300 family)